MFCRTVIGLHMGAGGGMANILVAEDSLSQALQLKIILQHGGHRVRQAGNGEAALSAIQEDEPSGSDTSGSDKSLLTKGKRPSPRQPPYIA